jgi:hypothetical protein
MTGNIILTIILVAAGGLFLAAGAYQYRVARTAQKHWSTTDGVVLASGLDAFDGADRKSRTTPRYVLQVVYEYRVNDQTYEGRQVGFGGTSFALEAARKKLRIYPQGVLVTVYYDPANPNKAVLEPDAAGAWIYLLLGLIILLGGGLSAWLLPQ